MVLKCGVLTVHANSIRNSEIRPVKRAHLYFVECAWKMNRVVILNELTTKEPLNSLSEYFEL